VFLYSWAALSLQSQFSCYSIVMKLKNTTQKGSVRYIVFKEGDVWYAVGLEFNIVVEGDDPREVMLSLFGALSGYVQSARKIKTRPHVLNQKPDDEYEKLWVSVCAKRSTASRPIYTFGEWISSSKGGKSLVPA